MPCYIPRRFPRRPEASGKWRRILVGSVRICLTRADGGICTQTIVRPRKKLRAGQESEWKISAGRSPSAQGTNRMNSFPDRTSSPALPPAVRELAALCEYSEGSHEANARQRNSRRGVARRTG